MLLLKSCARVRSVDGAWVGEAGPVPPLMTNVTIRFHFASGFATQILAYMLDSLVRVSRRVNENHFVSVANTRLPRAPRPVPTLCPQQCFALQRPNEAGPRGVIPTPKERAVFLFAIPPSRARGCALPVTAPNVGAYLASAPSPAQINPKRTLTRAGGQIAGILRGI